MSANRPTLASVEELLSRAPVHIPTDTVRLEHTLMLRAAMQRVDGEQLAPVQGVGSARSRMPARIAVVAAASILMLGGAGLAAAYVAHQAPTQTAVVRCFARVTTDYASTSLALDVGAAVSPSGAGPVASDVATSLCGAEWAQGSLSETQPYVRSAAPTGLAYPVPGLAACVLPDGGVGVFPGGSRTCESLGLASPA